MADAFLITSEVPQDVFGALQGRLSELGFMLREWPTSGLGDANPDQDVAVYLISRSETNDIEQERVNQALSRPIRIIAIFLGDELQFEAPQEVKDFSSSTVSIKSDELETVLKSPKSVVNELPEGQKTADEDWDRNKCR